MEIMSMFRLLPSIIILFLYHACVDADETNHHQKTYIIHMDKSDMPASFDNHQQWYESSLKLVSVSANMLYTYNSVIHGYSARLTSEQARLLEEQLGVLSVQEDVKYELHTTRSPKFLGLLDEIALPPKSNATSDVIIGMLDSGVWPESSSFDDKELGPVPRGWKGECEVGKTFYKSSCNRKLIGARFFSKGYEALFGPVTAKSPRDDEGHGTHTASTAAGSTVVGANLFGYAKGTARGMAKHARIAVYKVCWHQHDAYCMGSDILAGMEKAIEDGVDILSLSLGGGINDYLRDLAAIGAFTATSRGIFVSCSAGNEGPYPKSLSNIAPWITTVGAGTIDRQFPAHISLGNGKKFIGSSLYSGKPLPSSFTPLVFAGNVSKTSGDNKCSAGSLIPIKVKGKIVICDKDSPIEANKGLVVKDAGGIGMILVNDESQGRELIAEAHFIPAADVDHTTGDILKKYVFTDPNPTATIATGPGNTRLGVRPSPGVAFFSSRGPNQITPDILKPDIIAPGVEILGGWTGKVGPTGLQEDIRHVDFNIISGTSMSCPHISGIAALIKAVHPKWSPAAIRSALMTTAYSTYKNGKRIQDLATGLPATPFDYGAGHVDPMSALDPGLVYDATIDNYIDFLCAINYSSRMIKTITKKDHSCMDGKKYRVGDLNYPSFSVPFKNSAQTVVKYTRTLTNVGNPATYKVSLVKETKAVKILVEPEVLVFSKRNEKKSFTVTFTGSSMPSRTTKFEYLKWMDGKHAVVSPIAFRWT